VAVARPTSQPGDAIQLLGISSLAIGFAFRDTLQNCLAGILLLLHRLPLLGFSDSVNKAASHGVRVVASLIERGQPAGRMRAWLTSRTTSRIAG
jgi:hypothetical protein